MNRAREKFSFVRVIVALGTCFTKTVKSLSLLCEHGVAYSKAFSNFIIALSFRCGYFPKGQRITINTRTGKKLVVCRSADCLVLDQITKRPSSVVISEDHLLIDGVKLRQGTSDTYIYKEIFKDRVYDRCLDLINRDSVIIDAGMHVGIFSILVAPFVKKVIGVEASRDNFLLAIDNLEHNNLCSKVTPLNRALWSKSNVPMILDNEIAGDLTGNFRVKQSNGAAGTVLSLTLRDIIKESGAERLSLMKMDIEGSEYEVLMNDPTTLSCIDNLLIEYHKDITQRYTEDELFALLKAHYKFLTTVQRRKNSGVILAYN